MMRLAASERACSMCCCSVSWVATASTPHILRRRRR